LTPVPRYFFHVHDGVDQPDNEGVEFPSAEEARAQAVTAMGEALRDLDGAFWDGDREWRMTVNDSHGNTVCVLRVSGAYRPTP
jgi:hypothetical protein